MNTAKPRRFWLLQIAGVVALLPVGLYIIGTGLLPYGYAAYGHFYGSFHADIAGVEDPSIWVTLNGRSRPRWQWSRPSNFSYTSLEIRWTREDDSGGTALADLASSQMSIAGSVTELSEESLRDLLLGPGRVSPSPEEAELVKYSYSLLLDAKNGRLPAPRHHPYHFKDPAYTMMTHFSLGNHYPYAVTVWVMICLVLLAAILVRQGSRVLRDRK